MDFKLWLLREVNEWVINPETGLPMAAGVLPICRATGRILPNRRGRGVADYNGSISTWGGALEDGETPEIAAKRELQEEAKFSGSIQMIPAYVFRNDKYEYHNFVGIVNEEFGASLNQESEFSGWMTLKELMAARSNWHPFFADFMSHSGSIVAKAAKPS